MLLVRSVFFVLECSGVILRSDSFSEDVGRDRRKASAVILFCQKPQVLIGTGIILASDMCSIVIIGRYGQILRKNSERKPRR